MRARSRRADLGRSDELEPDEDVIGALLKPFLRRWVIASGRTELVRGLVRAPRLDAETRIGSVALLGLIVSSGVLVRVGILVWWLVTGRRIPG